MAALIRANTSQWKVGVAALVPRCSATAKKALRMRMQQAFEESQARVHVVTGRLKASGTITETESLLNLEIEISYGGGDVDYAGYEELYHPYLEPTAVGELSSFGPDGVELEGPFD